MKWGTGGINIDGCRVGEREREQFSGEKKPKSESGANTYGDYDYRKSEIPLPQGRFPANVILSHHPDCILKGTKEIDSNSHYPEMDVQGYGKNMGGKTDYIKEGERVKKEIVEDYDCHPDCPFNFFPHSTSGEMDSISQGKNHGIYGKFNGKQVTAKKSEGSAARFFYSPKPSQSERNAGCDNLELGQAPASARSTPAEGRENALGKPRRNHHPTVKSLSLMSYLIKMITPPNGIVLDCFAGSGTTLIAAKKLDFDYIGIEQNPDYIKIAERRIHDEIGLFA